MKTVTKIILCSSVFCYFAGLWIIASRFGVVKLISKYGMTQAFDQIPKDFPQMKYLYIGLIAYTVVFAALVWIICRYSERTSEEQEQLQQEAAVVVSYSERMNRLLSMFERSDMKDAKTKQKLQNLTRRIASLPPAVARNANMSSEVSNIIGRLHDLLSDGCTADSFLAAVDTAVDDIDSVKRRCINLK